MKEADDPEAHMRCKGTPKSSMKLYVRHENYLRCLFHSYAGENMKQNDDVNVIHSREHELFSIKTSKVSLSCNDSKRDMLRDNIHTLVYMAIGHRRSIHFFENLQLMSTISPKNQTKKSTENNFKSMIPDNCLKNSFTFLFKSICN